MGWPKGLLLSLTLWVSREKLRDPSLLSLSLSFSHCYLTRIHMLRRICQIFDGNSPLLPLNLWDWSYCKRSSFNFEPAVANGIMQRDYGNGGKERREAPTAIAKAVGVLWVSLSLYIYIYISIYLSLSI